MSFLSALFGSADQPKKPAAPEAHPDLPVYQAVINLIAVSPALQTQLTADVQRAFDAPQSFYDDGEYTLAEYGRGLRYPKDARLTPKFVLIDTLIDWEQMAEVDWKASEEDIRFAINDILDAKGFALELPQDEQYDDPDTFSVFQTIDDDELQPAGYCLAFLDIDSDSYVFTVVPLAQQAEAEQLFARLGQLK